MVSLIVRVEGKQTTTSFEGTKADLLRAVNGMAYSVLNSGALDSYELQEMVELAVEEYENPSAWDRFRREASWFLLVGGAALAGGYTVAWILQRLVGG